MSHDEIDVREIERSIADILKRQSGVDPERALGGVPFVELDKGFDSLAFVTMQLMIESRFGVRLAESAFDPKARRRPRNVPELAAALLPQILASRQSA